MCVGHFSCKECYKYTVQSKIQLTENQYCVNLWLKQESVLLTLYGFSSAFTIHLWQCPMRHYLQIANKNVGRLNFFHNFLLLIFLLAEITKVFVEPHKAW